MRQLSNVMKGRKVVYPKETIYESGLKGLVGISLSRIKDSEPHYHKKITEWYLVIKGTGIAYLNEKKINLKRYDVLMIPPKTTHHLESKKSIELWVLSSPPWTKADHYKI